MADALVQVAPDSTGAKIDNTSLTVGANTVMRQRVNLAGRAATELADVRAATPANTDIGLVTRDVGPRSGLPGSWARQPGTVLLYEGFDTNVLDTNRWTSSVGGAGSTVFVGGGATPPNDHRFDLTNGTTAASFAQVISTQMFIPRGAVPMAFHCEAYMAAIPTGNSVIWGVGDNADYATFNGLRGAFFRHDLTTFQFEVYSKNGNLDYTVSLTPLTIGSGTLASKVSTEIHIAHDRIEAFVDGVSVGSYRYAAMAVPAYMRPFFIFRSMNNSNGATVAAGASAGFYMPSVMDYGRNNIAISDPTYPWRAATVSAAGALSADVSDRAGRLLGAIQGDTARDVANTGNPIQNGGVASLPWVLPTPVTADGRRVPMWLDRRGRVIVGPQRLPTYASAIRSVTATAGKRNLATGALTGNTAKQIATIYHLVGATKRARLLYVKVIVLELATLAGYIEFEIQRLSATTAPATGNPAITPLSFDSGDAAAECAVLALPGTQGSLGAVDQAFGHVIMNLGITATVGPTTVPPQYPIPIILFDSRSGMDENKDAALRAGVAEGFAIMVRSSVVNSVLFIAEIQHTEEP